LLTSKQEVKNDWSNKSNPNSDHHQNQAGPSKSNPKPNSNINEKEKEKYKGSTLQLKKTDYLYQLSKDGKLTSNANIALTTSSV